MNTIPYKINQMRYSFFLVTLFVFGCSSSIKNNTINENSPDSTHTHEGEFVNDNLQTLDTIILGYWMGMSMEEKTKHDIELLSLGKIKKDGDLLIYTLPDYTSPLHKQVHQKNLSDKTDNSMFRPLKKHLPRPAGEFVLDFTFLDGKLCSIHTWNLSLTNALGVYQNLFTNLSSKYGAHTDSSGDKTKSQFFHDDAGSDEFRVKWQFDDNKLIKLNFSYEYNYYLIGQVDLPDRMKSRVYLKYIGTKCLDEIKNRNVLNNKRMQNTRDSIASSDL